jgi:hypothetical protein
VRCTRLGAWYYSTEKRSVARLSRNEEEEEELREEAKEILVSKPIHTKIDR